MAFTINDKNINRKGRKVGSSDIKTNELKTLLLSVFNDNLNEILKHQQKMSLNQRLMLNKTLLPYILPTIKVDESNNYAEQPLFELSYPL